jgi:hypothetical protein
MLSGYEIAGIQAASSKIEHKKQAPDCPLNGASLALSFGKNKCRLGQI